MTHVDIGYHVSGSISALIFLLTLYGLWHQAAVIRNRRADLLGSFSTDVLSLNQYVSSFLAYYTFLVYGFCTERFNHYLVWPRLTATILSLAIIFEIARDRRDALSKGVFACGILLISCALYLMIFNLDIAVQAKPYSQFIILVVTFILAQGYIHQMLEIRSTRSTGAVALRTHQLIFLKDLSTIVFAAYMGVGDGWPIMIMCGVSALTKIGVMYQFQWIKTVRSISGIDTSSEVSHGEGV